MQSTTDRPDCKTILPDFRVRSLHDDLAAALDAAVYLSGTGRKEVAARIGDAVQNALAQVRLPRSEPEAYLARLGEDAVRGGSAAHGGSAANAEHRESLAALWEAWRFDAPPAPLPEEVLVVFQAGLEQLLAQRLQPGDVAQPVLAQADAQLVHRLVGEVKTLAWKVKSSVCSHGANINPASPPSAARSKLSVSN